MFDPTKKSFLDCVLQAELEEFSTTCSTDMISTRDREEFIDGAVLTKVPINRQSIANLTTSQGFVCKEDYRTSNYSRPADSHLLDDVTDQIVNIKPQPFDDCMKLIAAFRQKAGKHFYGALLRERDNKKVIMNPLHILTSLSIIENLAEVRSKQYSTIIYMHSNKAEMDKIYNTHQADEDEINKQIDSIMQGFASKVDNQIDGSAKPVDGGVEITYRVAKDPDEHRTYEHYLVAHQLMTKSVIAPTYGTSILEMRPGSRTEGIIVSPFGSANISHRDDNYDRPPQYGSVCCGSLDNSTMRGLRSLTHSNLSSPYVRSNLKAGALAYADVMSNRAFDLYIKTNIIDSFDTSNTEAFALANKPKYSPELLACEVLTDFMRIYKEENPETYSASICLAAFKEMNEYKESLHEEQPIEPDNTGPF